MKKQEIKKMTKDEALKNIDKLKKDLFNFRFQKINSQVTNPSKIIETKKTINIVSKRLLNRLEDKSSIILSTFERGSTITETPYILLFLMIGENVFIKIELFSSV